MKPFTDEQLLERLREGNNGALGLIYERYKTSLFTFCVRLLRDRQKAEDTVHDVFLKLSNAIRSLDNDSAFRPWLFRVARNEALMRLRKEPRSEQLDTDTVWDPATPYSKLEQKQTTETVQFYLEQLKVEYREVLLLREYEQLSYAEIAAVTGDTESSVKSRLCKARKALSGKLAAHFKGGQDL